MSAVVCGKRSNIFEDSPSSPPVSKRIRCSSSSSSPGRSFSPPRAAATSYNLSNSVLDHLVALFPDMDKQFLEKALEEAGDDLDSAIKRLNGLRISAAASVSDITQEIGNQFRSEGQTPQREEPPTESNLPVDGAEWVELLVREVLTAPNVDDAKARLSQALEALEKSICANATAEAAKNFQEENIMVKQQLEALLHENTILKRAVSIQHERQKAVEEMGQELHQLKQLVSQYQEQVRTLEVNNYALAMHLKQAQQNSQFPGRFHPDVF
ncbi:Ubiquitin system component Cue protein [Striga hermonthica]|uniref:Ubiquitin system component Cue protein n=1 Tax=Striga hermonthica TaxID=68872 RepID=A0A9N7R2Z1_STRHE|nr:Ubiquitin system component Cue protein [Striga hermonthica]